MQSKQISHTYRFLDIITALFVAILLISNVASSKITTIGFLTFDAGTILFPLSYIIGDMLTEVYGYSRARRAIWIGLLCNVIMAVTFMIVAVLPPAADWPHQPAYEAILGWTPRIVLASIIAYFIGEFLNSFMLARLKVMTKGKHLWMRTIGSTLVGQLLDTLIFVVIAFWGLLPTPVLISIIISNYIFKVAIEVFFTPITYKVVNLLKKKEHEDYYDRKTDFNPFALTKNK